MIEVEVFGGLEVYIVVVEYFVVDEEFVVVVGSIGDWGVVVVCGEDIRVVVL